MRHRSWLSILVILALALVLSAGAALAATDTGPIIIKGFSFQPNSYNALPGQEISIGNFDGKHHGIPHSLTARDGSFDTGIFTTSTPTIMAPTTPGQYPFACVVHPFMKGKLRVVG